MLIVLCEDCKGPYESCFCLKSTCYRCQCYWHECLCNLARAFCSSCNFEAQFCECAYREDDFCCDMCHNTWNNGRGCNCIKAICLCSNILEQCRCARPICANCAYYLSLCKCEQFSSDVSLNEDEHESNDEFESNDESEHSSYEDISLDTDSASSIDNENYYDEENFAHSEISMDNDKSEIPKKTAISSEESSDCYEDSSD